MKLPVWSIPLCLGVALAGCGKEQTSAPPAPVLTPKAPVPGATPTSPIAASTVSQPELDAVAKSKIPLKLALIVKTRNNPFFDPMIKAAESEARELGVLLEVQAPAQESDKEQQFAMVQNVAAKGVQAILVAPADSKAIVPALRDAAKKGILIINIDNRVDKPSAQAAGLDLAGYVGADNETGGKLAGGAMVEALAAEGKASVLGTKIQKNVPNLAARAPAKVAILEGIRGADNAESRKRGFEAGVNGVLDIVARESAEWDTQKAYAKFQSMLAAHPDIEGLFCANDKMAVGAVKAIQEAGKKGKIKVFGYDNIADIKPYLKSGEMCGTIEQHPDLMGKYGVRMAVGILTGKVQKGKEFLVPLEVIKK